MNQKTYQICTQCVMDTSDMDIVFDSEGICMYCREAEKKIPLYKFDAEQSNENLRQLYARIKKRQLGKYDSIIGLSGGVDSSYIAYLAMLLKLNPLCVHFDNGWNSDTAIKNIQKIIDITGFDLYTYVINWPEFKDLQRSFFKASVVDIEMLTDHAIFATLFKIRKEKKITSVLSGTNYITEHGMPRSWNWNKMDLTNIKDIHKRFGEGKLNTFPMMSNLRWLAMRRFGLGGSFEEPLNQIYYVKAEAMAKLREVFGWEYYGGKHYESVFTKFYQAYILPKKFKIDKRRVHYSALVRSGEIERVDACIALSEPLYPDDELKRDRQFVLKKLGFSEESFIDIMNAKPVPHDEYNSDKKYIELTKWACTKFGIATRIQK